MGSEGEVFVANSGSDNISVINDTLDTVVGSIPVGSDPSAILNFSGYVYVTNELSDNVSVIDVATLKVVDSISVGTDPDGITSSVLYPTIYVANAASNNVTAIDSETNDTIANIGVGLSPGAVIGTASGQAFVVNAGGTNLTPIYEVNNTANASSIPVGSGPSALAIRYAGPFPGFPATLWVANEGSDNVSVVRVNTTSGNQTARTLANVAVGSAPDAVVYDPADGRVYVANSGSNNVSVIDGASYAPIRPALGVGQDPSALAYDTGNGCLYVANQGSANVSIICDLMPPTTHGSIPLASPGGIAYDNGNGNLYVSTGDSGVAVINATTGQVVDPNITVGSSYPVWTNMAYDAADGDIFVTNSVSDSISVINGSTDSVSRTISLGSGAYDSPVGIAWDGANGFVYVRLTGDYVAVINGSSGNLVGSIEVGYAASSPYLFYDTLNHDIYVETFNSTPVQHVLVLVINGSSPIISGPGLFIGQGIQLQPSAGAMALDPENGLIYAFSAGLDQDWPNGNLSIINGSTNTLLPRSIPVPYWGPGAVYDTATGMMYWLGDWNLTVVDPSDESVVATLGVGELPAAIAVDSDTGSLYVTNPNDNNITVIDGPSPAIVSFTATPESVVLGSSTAFNVQVENIVGSASYAYSGLPTGCHSANLSHLPCTATSVGSFTVRVFVNDTAGNSTNATVRLTVNRYAIASFVASPPTVTVSSTTSFLVNITGARANLTYTYTGLPSGCSSLNTSSLACTPTVAGAVTVRVYANDSSVESASTTTVLNVSYVVISSITADPSTVEIDSPTNFSSTITVVALPAVSGLTYSYSGLPSGCPNVNRTTLVCTPSSSGVFSIRVYVNDSRGHSVSATTTLTVAAALSVSATASPDPTDAGASVDFLATVTGGAGRYSYSWHFGDGGSSSAQNPTHSYTVAGSFLARIWVNDSEGGSVASTVPMSIAPALVVVLTVSNSTPALGQTIAINASVLGGVSPYSYAYQGLPPGCVSINSSLIGCLPTQAGSYNLTVVVTDHYGVTVNASVPLLVVFDFTVVSPSQTPVNQQFTLTVKPEGGYGTLTYNYGGLPPGCSSADASSLTCTPTQVGTYNISVSVHDQAGNRATNVVRLSVVQSAVSAVEWPLVLGGTTAAIVLAAMAVGIALQRRRKTRDLPAPASPSSVDDLSTGRP
ncbi:MAG: PKD domain-containing protein [Thermoplasmata archaeon]